MPNSSCPICTVDDIVEHSEKYECMTCGYEWPKSAEQIEAQNARVVKDAHGNLLTEGDIVQMIKDLKLKGSSQVLKRGTKSNGIRFQDGDHEISCKMDGIAIALKAQFVKKVIS